jgi:hypothetical protein
LICGSSKEQHKNISEACFLKFSHTHTLTRAHNTKGREMQTRPKMNTTAGTKKILNIHTRGENHATINFIYHQNRKYPTHKTFYFPLANKGFERTLSKA